jgi:hypothetical protein
MNNSFKFFAMVAFLSMAIVGSGIPTQLASAQTASQHSDLVQTVSTWQFDQSGHLISVPGRLEAKYDANDHLQEVRARPRIPWLLAQRPGRSTFA